MNNKFLLVFVLLMVTVGHTLATFAPCSKDHGCTGVPDDKKVFNAVTGHTYCCLHKDNGPIYNDLTLGLGQFTCVCEIANGRRRAGML